VTSLILPSVQQTIDQNQQLWIHGLTIASRHPERNGQLERVRFVCTAASQIPRMVDHIRMRLGVREQTFWIEGSPDKPMDRVGQHKSEISEKTSY
jgi:hypothetical protein